MWDKCWDLAVDAFMATFMPLVCFYYALCSSPFLNVAIQNGTYLEQTADALLSPVHYLFAAKKAAMQEDGTWVYTQRFSYEELFWVKTGASIAAFIPSLFLGSGVKALTLLDPQTKNRLASLQHTLQRPQETTYKKLGLAAAKTDLWAPSLRLPRRPGDELALSEEKEALKAIAELLNQHEILWWLDCGTCLGAYRHEGVIPWDHDLDIAILLPDFDNVFHALKKLDPNRFIVQDWSARDFPKTYLKVYVVNTSKMIDIYGFDIFPEERRLGYFFSFDRHLFFPEWFKERERKFTAKVAYSTLFPLKKSLFDGIEVYMPNDCKTYLERYYGNNLSPAKIYNEELGVYEKDFQHPYWQRLQSRKQTQ